MLAYIDVNVNIVGTYTWEMQISFIFIHVIAVKIEEIQ